MHRLWLLFAQSVTVAVAVLFVVTTLRPEWLATSRPAAAPTAQPLPSLAAPAPGSVPSYRDGAQRALPSVVHIFTSKEIRSPRHPFMDDPVFRHFFGDRIERQAQRKASGLGSGVLVSPEGYILTNNHVIDAADEIEVALQDGRKLQAQLVGRDEDTDLAVLRINARAPLPAIQFTNSDNLRVGDVVLAIGNPFGVGQTVTMGIVSALGRSHLGINTFEHFIQTDAAINPGNSGGALVDTEGRLVGINTAIYSRSGGSLGIGFAIPASFARNVMEQIIKNGSVERGWIGVEVQDVTPDLVAAYGMPAQGALIAGLVANGPAHRGGLSPGDVVTQIDGKPCTDPQSLLEAIAKLPPGQLARLRFWRQGQTVETNVQISRRPPMGRQ